MSEYYLIANIISVHGKDGFVKISSYSDFPDRFFSLDKVYIDFFKEKKEFIVDKVLEQKKNFIIKFRNFDNENDVQILIGKDVYVDEERVIKLPIGSYFVHDLLESKVYRNSKLIGILKDVLSPPANDVYVIEGLLGEEILIPATTEYIESFDKEKKFLILRPGNDLYEDDEN